MGMGAVLEMGVLTLMQEDWYQSIIAIHIS